jgi:hypothetical protein
MPSVTAQSEVYLSEFDDDDIIERAIEIVKEHQKRRASQSKWDRDKAMELDGDIEELAKALGAMTFVGDGLPPASTAARITSMDALRAYTKKPD